ncbi:MAG: helix-turn-helix domain-containing protein [Burkholderiales bacterium]
MSANTLAKPAPSRLLSAKAAAAYLGIPYTSLRDRVFQGDLPVVKFGRRWFFKREDLERLIESHTERLA